MDTLDAFGLVDYKRCASKINFAWLFIKED